MWNRRTDYHHTVLAEHIRNSASGWTQYQNSLDEQGIRGTGAFAYVDHIIGNQAATLAVNDVFFGLACIFICLVPFVWLAKPPFTARGSDAAH
jgi:DHA2 family multidrug resistance protein